ncbi:hypothetical protein HK096_007825 [Nowakowskiella sp. JEL0078]|nr:hypothetical protein HK096_007825 [Nowakowskiella sp. JEL0078]
MCLWYCIIYGIACATKTSPNYLILIFGRVMSGISTSLLFSVFEAWMVGTFNSSGKLLNNGVLDLLILVGFNQSYLSDIFSTGTFLNGLAAITSGILADILCSLYFNLVYMGGKLSSGIFFSFPFCKLVAIPSSRKLKSKTVQNRFIIIQ